MPANPKRIGIVAPACRLDPQLWPRLHALAQEEGDVELQFHPQCQLSAGHFAGSDEARTDAFVEYANDASLHAIWYARGGYGSCRIIDAALPRLNVHARAKLYMGYSDTGILLAALYKAKIGHVAHGPMPADILRDNGAIAVKRALSFLSGRNTKGIETQSHAQYPHVAFNMTILSSLIGTPHEPNLEGHALLLEEVSEYMYRIDRTMFQLTSSPNVRRVKAIRLGRCSQIPPNEPDFAQTEEEVVSYWCRKAGIDYQGRADIGHDIDNKIVAFGPAQTFLSAAMQPEALS